MNRRYLQAWVLAAASLVGVAAWPQTLAPKSRAPVTVNFVNADIEAVTRAFAAVTLYAKVSGYLKNLKVDKGDHVKAGQMLATIEASGLIDRKSAPWKVKGVRLTASPETAISDHRRAHAAYIQRALKYLQDDATADDILFLRTARERYHADFSGMTFSLDAKRLPEQEQGDGAD